MKITTIITLLGSLMTLVVCHGPFAVVFQWNTIDVTWPTPEDRQRAFERGEYIPANNPIAGIKFWKDRMYLTVPRWKPGVPVTLATTSATPQHGVTAPRLEPYPNWQMQKLGDCDAFQFVQSMEIDPKGRMWVLDSGRTETMTLEAKSRCPPRLVILDIGNNGTVLRSHRFPESVTPAASGYLNDIVVDHEMGGFAYITDNSKDDPGIIVFSLKDNKSWKIRHDSMKSQAEAVSFMVAKTHIISPINVDGIAMSPASAPQRFLYYSPLSSFHLYSLPVEILRNNSVSNLDFYVRDLGRKNSQTDGMVMSAQGILYFGLLADDAVAMWDTKSPFATGQRVISRDHDLMQWPDSFAFDEYGNFWCVTNALQNFMVNQVNVNAPNYRIIKTRDVSKNYQYYENGEVPVLPEVTGGAGNIFVNGSITHFMAICLSVLFVFVVK